MKIFYPLALALFLNFALFSGVHAAAPTPQPQKAVVDKSVEVPQAATTPVLVEHEGTDTLGAKLAFQLKGAFNESSLFTLTEKDEPKLKVYVTTVEEFPSRPHIASAYSIVWAFVQKDGTLNFLLARDIGLVVAEDLDALVSKITARTDGIAVKYSYLFSR